MKTCLSSTPRGPCTRATCGRRVAEVRKQAQHAPRRRTTKLPACRSRNDEALGRPERQATARWDGDLLGSDPVRSPRRPGQEISSEYTTRAYARTQRLLIGDTCRCSALRCRRCRVARTPRVASVHCRRGPGAAVTSHGSAGLQRTQRRSASGGERGGGREAARRSPPVLERPVTRQRPSFLSFFSVSSRIFLSVRASRARA